MYILDLAAGERRAAQISEVEQSDFKKISVKRYLFKWKLLAKECRLFKLTLYGSDDILGLMALFEYPDEQRIEIKLLTASSENIGRHKQYDRIAGCLIAFAAKKALDRFEGFPAISLLPKTSIRQHYITRYGMIAAGRQLYLEDIGLLNIINEYLT